MPASAQYVSILSRSLDERHECAINEIFGPFMNALPRYEAASSYLQTCTILKANVSANICTLRINDAPTAMIAQTFIKIADHPIALQSAFLCRCLIAAADFDRSHSHRRNPRTFASFVESLAAGTTPSKSSDCAEDVARPSLPVHLKTAGGRYPVRSRSVQRKRWNSSLKTQVAYGRQWKAQVNKLRERLQGR